MTTINGCKPFIKINNSYSFLKNADPVVMETLYKRMTFSAPNYKRGIKNSTSSIPFASPFHTLKVPFFAPKTGKFATGLLPIVANELSELNVDYNRIDERIPIPQLYSNWDYSIKLPELQESSSSSSDSKTKSKTKKKKSKKSEDGEEGKGEMEQELTELDKQQQKMIDLYEKSLVPTRLFDMQSDDLEPKEVDNDLLLDDSGNGVKLYDFQVESINFALANHRGIIKCATGGGKTMILASLIKALGDDVSVLILVTKRSLVTQIHKSLVEAGVCNAGRVSSDYFEPKRVTISTLMSAHKIEEQCRRAQVLLVDEVHEFTSPTARNAFKMFDNAYARFGFSATPFKIDDPIHNNRITSVFGTLLCDITTKALTQKNILANAYIHFYPINYHIKQKSTKLEKKKEKLLASGVELQDSENIILEDDKDGQINGETKESNNNNSGGKLSFYDIESDLIAENDYLNESIVKLVDSIESGRIMILVKRISHGDRLARMMPNAYWVKGDDNVETREFVLHKLKYAKNQKVVAIFSAIGYVGIDVRIHHLINACGGKDPNMTLQKLGRGLRTADDKQHLDYHDFYFSEKVNKILKSHSGSRMSLLKKEGHTVLLDMESIDDLNNHRLDINHTIDNNNINNSISSSVDTDVQSSTTTTTITNIKPITSASLVGTRDDIEYLDHDHIRYNNVPITITLNKVNVSLRGESENVFTKIGLCERKQQRLILNNISAIIRPGKMCAILGGSGSGKTTLLNTISGRFSKAEMKVDGQILFNDIVSPPPELVKSAVGYVMQKDYLLPNLTVRESLMYSARLRLPVDMPKQDKINRVEEVIAELGLRDCANTRVGGNGKRGISGGEKRRVSIGCQMLTDPSVLFLDEPTTGLDSFTAYQVTQTMVSIARQNRTVICTIHQPRSDIFKLFDQVMLLSKGQLVYIGSTSSMIEHFSRLNFKCPKMENPADYFNYRSVTLEQNSVDRLRVLVAGFQESEENQLMLNTIAESVTNSGGKSRSIKEVKLSSQLRASTPFYYSIPALTSRSYLNHLRDVPAAITRISQIVSFGLMMCICFLRISDDQYGVQNRSGFLYESLSMIFIALLNCVALFPTERNLFYRERSDGLYSTLAFFFSYGLVELPFNIVGSLGYAAVTYFTLGLQNSAVRFFRFALVIFFLLFSGESVGLFVCSLFYDVGMATTISNVLLSLFSVLAGFFRPNGELPAVLKYFNYALPTKWAAEVIAINEFQGLTFDCPGNQAINGTICPITTGEQVLESYGWNDINIYQSIYVMIIISVGYRIISLLTLQFNKRVVVL
ncbi:hypothetical protein PPL_09305 [Heterostelium album PN500]|uniref:Uncharacterized protein n=1 Tax=Heterostelium pallidum (strain ATCC 26659 / Pp 5 / PN500) TaxID=670386 RepID=D3BL73_HETP5|nr:hypothetical protein PPL_09305 [Heterostelium album PN500]EFA77807.1 hypothetical protein PPL_09305 [Heterostelium album PN500]|eukprot:XP_020429935.1 hypothetical protein PPL_09305 [Heterostelium album PN500]